MEKNKITVCTRTILADLITPVSIFMKVRDKYPNPILLESTDFNGDENSYSIVCFSPIASFVAHDEKMTITLPSSSKTILDITEKTDVPSTFKAFIDSFDIDHKQADIRLDGFFGYNSYDSVKYFETIKLRKETKPENKIPEICFSFYRYVVVYNHFKSEVTIMENLADGQECTLDAVEFIIKGRSFPEFGFKTVGAESSNFTDEGFRQAVSRGKEHCYRGNVFQIVLSRQYAQQFEGDEFCVYRALRAINPSPYLFFFDYGSFKIFGSSPEAQLIIRDGRAIINPIAGTFRRTGDDTKDAELAFKLTQDPKENAEHVMLVDLARNDLSRNGEDVRVEKYREVQYFSHVIHLVSKVSGRLLKGANPLRVMADTFPAGTLSGAPKFKAMELISELEPQGRGYYGGSIGYVAPNGTLNQAIMIRTFLSKGNKLYYQAGAGVVAKSDEESEMQEVNNKLAALKKAIHLAGEVV